MHNIEAVVFLLAHMELMVVGAFLAHFLKVAVRLELKTASTNEEIWSVRRDVRFFKDVYYYLTQFRVQACLIFVMGTQALLSQIPIVQWVSASVALLFAVAAPVCSRVVISRHSRRGYPHLF